MDNEKPDPVAAELSKYPDLVPGAVQQLSAIWASDGSLPADKLAETIASKLEGSFAQRYRDPEAVARKLANGGTPSPLREALERNASRLAPGQVDALVPKLASEVVNKTPAQIAGHVERFLRTSASHPYLAVRPPEPAHVMRIRDVINQHFSGEVNESQIASLARDPRTSAGDDGLLISMIARTLRLPATDRRVSGRPASIERRADPAPTVGEPRAQRADGTFEPVQPPPPRRSLVK
jgi:hypothetical protein